jgi:hypothetical protein
MNIWINIISQNKDDQIGFSYYHYMVLVLHWKRQKCELQRQRLL